MKLNVMTASATIKYLTVNQNITLFSISVLLDLNLEETREILRGYRPFTKNEYMKLVQEFEELEFNIEYFENTRRSNGNI